MSAALLVFDFFYFIDSGDVPAALEISGKKVLNNSLYFNINLLRCQTADLSIIMAAGAVGGKDIVALSGADAPHFIGGDAHADAGAAYQYTPIIISLDNSLGNEQGNIRIINSILRIAAEVVIGVSGFGYNVNNGTFQITTLMVIANSNAHRNYLLYLYKVYGIQTAS
jgi:hypothetical protein